MALNQQDTAVAAHYERLRATAPVYLRIERGSDSVELTAIKAQTKAEAQDDRGMITTVIIDDFLIKADELVLSPGVGLTAPVRGDVVKVLTALGGSVVRTFEVLPPSESMKAWRHSDPGRLWLRVHTKQVG